MPIGMIGVMAETISETNSSWTSLSFRSVPHLDDYNAQVQLSVCLTSFHSRETKVITSSGSNRTELILTNYANPEPVRVEGNSKKAPATIFNSSSVIKQFGADNSTSSLTKRGILALETKNDWFSSVGYSDDWPTGWSYANESATPTMVFGFRPNLLDQTVDDVELEPDTWQLCSYCPTSPSFHNSSKPQPVSLSLAAIFQDSLQKTQSPATALQAVLTTYMLSRYYNR